MPEINAVPAAKRAGRKGYTTFSQGEVETLV